MNCQFCSTISVDISSHFKHLKRNHPFQMTYKCIYQKCYRKFSTLPSLQKHSLTCSFRMHQLQKPIQSQDDLLLQTTVVFQNSENIAKSNLCDNNNICPVEIDIEPNNIENCILKFITQLYNKPSVSRSVIQTIVEEFQSTVNNLSDYFIQKLKAQLPSELHYVLNDCFEIPLLKDICSEFKRLGYLQKSKYFISPQSFLIGELYDNKKEGQKTILAVRKCEGHIVPIRETLKALLELPGFYEKLLSVLETDTAATYIDKTYTSVCDGTIWKSIRQHYKNKIVMPLFLYYDDFETSNPLGSAAGIHKVGGLYCSIATLPAQYIGLLENIFLVQLIHSQDRTHFGNEKCFRNVIEELKYLSDTGVVIRTNSGEEIVYFVIIAILGDNLGLNALFGFPESFSTNYFCRICRANKLTTRSQTVENSSVLRTPQNYSEDISLLTHGVKEECIFNEIPHFDCSINVVCDIMHDLFEGVCRYDLAKIIRYFLTKKFFSIEKLNERIKYFNHQSRFDRGNKMRLIKMDHIRKGYLITTAAEMSSLISYFTFIVGDLIPCDDEVWEFYLILCEIINIVTGRIISDAQINFLRYLIISHHEMYIRLFNDYLKPKYHFMIHYPGIITKMGPLNNLSSIRYEGFHKLSKTYSSIVSSRKNITLTLAIKLQLHCCYKLLCKKGLNDKIEIGREIGLISYNRNAHLLALIHTQILPKKDNLFKCNIQSLSAIEDNSLMEVSWIYYNNIMFKPEYIIISDNDENNLVFGVMTHIILLTSEIFFVIYKKCITLGFDIHFKAYEIILPHDNCLPQIYIVNTTEECNVKTCNFHISGEGRYFISVFDV